MLFDHSLFRKVLPYEGSTRIPFIVHVGKNVELAPGRARLRREREHCRAHGPHAHDSRGVRAAVPEGVEGSSLLGELTGTAPLDRAYLHGEHSGSHEQSNQWIVTPHDKYIWFTQTGVEQYFDLDARSARVREPHRPSRSAPSASPSSARF